MSMSTVPFTAALFDPDQPAPDGLSDGANRPAGRRFDVYRNNVIASLSEAVVTGFPLLASLLGEANIKPLATMFARAHPPTSPLMMQYGQNMPDFLTGLAQIAHLPYLADAARLDLALRRAYHAADTVPIAPEALSVAPELLMRAQLTLAPAVQILQSEHPIYDIWAFNTQNGAPKPRHEAQDILITRAEFDPVVHLLPLGGAAWITALSTGHSFGAALDQAPEGFDLGATLGLLLQGGALTSLTLKD